MLLFVAGLSASNISQKFSYLGVSSVAIPQVFREISHSLLQQKTLKSELSFHSQSLKQIPTASTSARTEQTLQEGPRTVYGPNPAHLLQHPTDMALLFWAVFCKHSATKPILDQAPHLKVRNRKGTGAVDLQLWRSRSIHPR